MAAQNAVAAATAAGSSALPSSLVAREAELERLMQIVSARGFRAGLLYGEHGVGKTSLLRAGLIPQLFDKGMVALYCGDTGNPIQELLAAVRNMLHLEPAEGEEPIPFLDRVVTRELGDRHVVFLLDHMERVLGDVAARRADDSLLSDIGDLFARVVTRSGGRGKFLFCCDSAHVHRFGALEQRTGSLFPPTTRFELERLAPQLARPALATMLERRRMSAAPSLVEAMVQALAQDGPILPADLETAATALASLRVTSPADLAGIDSGVDVLEGLQRTWIEATAVATGHRRAALGILGEIAASARPTPRAASWLAARQGLARAQVAAILDYLHQQGVLAEAPPSGQHSEPAFVLAHPALRTPVRELSAPAIGHARRLRGMLSAKVERGKRLSPLEYLRLKQAGFVPATEQEQVAFTRTRQLYTLIAAAVVAVPVLTLLVIYIAMLGRYYFDVDTLERSGNQRVLVRAGRPGLSSFHWLPASPGFGSIIADPGLSRPMVRERAWERARASDIGGSMDDEAYAAAARSALDPVLAALTTYAISGSGEALAILQKQARGPQELAAMLTALAPLARGSSEEIGFIEQALNDASPAVQAAALGVASQAAQRDPERYRKTMGRALAADDADLRRLAFAAVRELDDAEARLTLQAALTENPGDVARRELLAEVTALEAATIPSASTAASILVNREIPLQTRQTAREALRRAFTTDPDAAARAAADLVGNAEAPPADRVWALELMRDLAPKESYEAIASRVREALSSSEEDVSLAALPVYARIAPRDAAGELAVLRTTENPSEALRTAMARAWGEVAKIGEPAAGVALGELIEDDDYDVQTVAIEAYGNVGRGAVSKLIEEAKTARFDVAAGAVLGLANAIQVGAPRGMAWGGITHMWRRKGRPRRAAAEAFARLASSHARHTYSYLASAVRSSDDSRLRVIGSRGACGASVAGHEPSQRLLVRGSLDTDTEVRREIIQCVADNALPLDTASTIAVRLSYDGDPGIRTDAARALVRVIEEGDAAEPVAKAILRLLGDREREVRAIAARALGAMGQGAPEDAGPTLLRAYERAEEDEKLELLGTARAIGSGDLVAAGIVDRAPAVRSAALDTAIATRTGVAPTLNAALTDSDPGVRRAALARIARHAEDIDTDALGKSLRLALRDPDPAIARVALTTLVRLGDTKEVIDRLHGALDDRSESRRTQAAAAGIGLVERDALAAIDLLEPLMDDPSHDVRTAMLPALATAYASTSEADELATMLRQSERHAMRRLVATAGFVVLARTEDGRTQALKALSAVGEDDPPMARLFARIGSGLIESGADGIGFLTLLVP